MAGKISWEDLVRQTDAKVRARDIKDKKDFRKYTDVLLSLIPVQMMIGVFAAIYFYLRFGWKELEAILLSWIIGLTLAATIVTVMINKYKKLTKH